jgi:signal transduction histidine kinase
MHSPAAVPVPPSTSSMPGDSHSMVSLPAGAALVIDPIGTILIDRQPFPLPHLRTSCLQGRSLEEIAPPALGEGLRRLWHSFSRDGSSHVSEMELSLEAQEPVHYSLSLGALAHPEFPDLCVITVRDVRRRTDEVQDLLGTIQTLRERCREWEVTTRTAAHDVRSSLSAMTGFLQLLLRNRAQLPPGAETSLVQALQIGKRVQEGLKALQKSSEPQPLDAKRVALAPLGQRLFQALQAAYPGEAFTWHVESTDEAVRVPMTLTWGVLWNVLTNAVKYRREDRPLHIGLRAWVADGAIQLEVSDSGRGIPEGAEEAVFAWGQRRGGPLRVEGSGFGLFSARQQLASCGGRIWIEPCADGARVRMALPLEAERPLAQRESTG